MYQATCPSPRPPVNLQTQALGDGRIQATVTAGVGPLTLIRFGAMQNARIEVPGSSQTYGSNAEIKPPDGTTTMTFFLVGNPAAQAGQAPPPTTIPLTVFDGCGPNQPWSTFSGGGAAALQSTASVADTQVTEGSSGNTVVTFTVTLSVPSARPVTICYRTADGTARAGQDYIAADGTVTFNPGETSKAIAIQVRGNFSREPDKTFTITLSDPVNAGIGRAQATARIVDDDSLPTSGDDAYTAAVGQALKVGAGSGPPPGLLANDQAASQDAGIVSFGGLSAGGDVTSNAAGATANLGNGGSLRVNADGSFSFTSSSTFTGAFSFRYRAASASGNAEATVVIDVRATPNAVDDAGFSASGSMQLQIQAANGLLANDVRGTPPGSIVSFGGGSASGSVTSTTAGQPRELGNGGTLTVNPDGSFSFVAPSNASGPFTFQYRLQNAAGADDATGTIQVLRGATVTTTSGSSSFVEGGSPAIVDAGATITTPGNANLSGLTATLTTAPNGNVETLAASTAGTSIVATYTHPTLTLAGNDTVAHYQQVLRSIIYQNAAPTPVIGERAVEFQATSNGQAGNKAQKNVGVVGVNDPPVGTNTTVSTSEDTPYTFKSADFGFSDPTDTPPNAFQAVMIVARPGAGSLLLGKATVTDGQVITVAEIGSGPLLFVPASNANGAPYATFTFRVQDNGGTANGGLDLDQTARTMRIDVTPGNDAPVAVADAYSVNEDAAVKVDAATGVLSNDTDGDTPHASLTAVLVSGPSNASAFTLNPDGSFNYAPTAGFSGDDAFSYKANDGGLDSNTVAVSLSVSAINDAPTVSAPLTIQVAEDQTFTFSGPDSITLADSDMGGGSLTVTLGVTRGTLTLGGTSGLSFTTGDGPADAAMVFSGTLASINSALQGMAYRPDADSTGSDTLNLLVDDNGNTGSGGARTGSAADAITVNAVNDAPTATGSSVTTGEDTPNVIALTGADVETCDLTFIVVTEPANGILGARTDAACVAGAPNTDSYNVTYTPTSNHSGSDSFTYKVNDGAVDSAVVTVTITVTPANDPPTAQDDTYTTNEDTLLTIAAPGVLGNDSDPDSDTLSSILVAGPSSGSLTLNPNGSFVYTPASNVNGTATFTYKANDGTVDSNVATVTITVNAVNDPPVANAKSDLAAQASIPITFPSGTLGGSDPEGSPVSVDTTPTSVTNGAVTILANGGFTFTPSPASAGGTASFQYRVSDGSANSATAAVSLTVAGPPLYFVKSAAVGRGDCTLGNECTLATAANSSNAGNTTNARIYINDSGNHASAVTLASGGWLIGQGVTGTSFDSVFGITPPSGPGAGTLATRPAINTTSPTVQGTVTMHNSSNVRGLNINVTGSDRGLSANTKTGLVVNDIASIQTVNGRAVDLGLVSGTFAFGDITATGTGQGIVFGTSISSSTFTVNDVTTTSGSAVSLGSTQGTNFSFRDVTSTSGTAVSLSQMAGDVTFRSVSASAANSVGISAVTMSAGFSLSVAGQGTVAGSGGTIEGRNVGVSLFNARDVTLKNMIVTNSTQNGIAVASSGGTLTFDNLTVKDSEGSEITVASTSGTADVTVTGSRLSNNGASNGDVILVAGSGTANITLRVTKSEVSRNAPLANNNRAGIQVANEGGTMNVEVDNSTFSSLDDAIHVRTAGATPNKVTNVDIHDNPSFVGSKYRGIRVDTVNAAASDTVQARITNNVIGKAGVTNSGSTDGAGILVFVSGSGTLTTLIEGNTVQEIAFSDGILTDLIGGLVP